MSRLFPWRRPRQPAIRPVGQGTRPMVGYHVIDAVAPPMIPDTTGSAYDYLFAGDGVYLAASSELLYARVPVARAHIRGLAPVGARCRLVHGRIPGILWDLAMQHVDNAAAHHCEVMLAIAYDAERGYVLSVPEQQAGAWSVDYTPADDWLLELHSHRGAAARFSRTDDFDEQGFRLYAVVGRLDRNTPQVSVRCGAYGHYLPVPWVDVFDANPDAVDDLHGPKNLERKTTWVPTP